jgi:hypothetical protein
MVMETIAEQKIAPVLPAVEVLPSERAEWPNDAGREYSRLLRELNSWSRDHDWPMSSNSWIAEEAVRRGW